MIDRHVRNFLFGYGCISVIFKLHGAHLSFLHASSVLTKIEMFLLSFHRAEDLPLDEFSDVYLLDFVGPSGFVREISSKVGSVIILDHHKTALEMLYWNTSIGENVISVIDIERSGATIAYDYFKEKLLGDTKNLDIHSEGVEVGVGNELVPKSEVERVNWLFKYIEDGDLWRWHLQNSKAFSSGMKDLNIEYNIRSNPSLFEQLLALDLQHCISQGIVSLSHKQKLIDEVLKQSYKIALGGGVYGHCLAVNADSVSDLRSELGHQLANKSRDLKLRGIGAIVYRVPELENDQLLKISLRSVDIEDTTPISQEYGGGGHRNASSFMLGSAAFEGWKV
ncbi:hypothetical protein HHK36_014690 [Tetracentron sinense]|uniref:DHHA1 domain-containing protein n=1 Tax=Tetracentron sinense TaxID=13715 RepID=A0A834Z5Z4_TETSI|nr:hypothetical protein HHK36_014690 [Tetracentron sinense]